MNFQELRTTKDNYTRQTSDLNRNLAFAGIAVIWIFVSMKSECLYIPLYLLIALLLFVLTLTLDLLQYVFLSISWVLFFRYVEKRNNDKIKFPWVYLFNYREKYTKDNFKVPANISNIGYVFFFLKITSNIAAYGFLSYFIAKRIFSV